MRAILVPCVDGSAKGLRYACASSRGTLYLAYWDRVEELHPDGRVVSVYDARCRKRKADSEGEGRLAGVRMVTEGPNGVLYVSDRAGIHALRDGKVDTVVSDRDGLDDGDCYYIKFLPDGNMLAFTGRGSAPSIREYKEGVLVNEDPLLDCALDFDGHDHMQDILCENSGVLIIFNLFLCSARAVEGERIDPNLALGFQRPDDNFIASATVFGGDLYFTTLISGTPWNVIYKNGEPFLRFQDDRDIRGQLTSHASGGLYVVRGDRVYKVVTNPRWTIGTHRYYDQDIKRTVRAIMMMGRRKDCLIGRLPPDMLSEVFDWIVQ